MVSGNTGWFHLHFGREADARAVADQLADDLIPALVRPIHDWLVLVSVHSLTDDEFDALSDRLKRLAAENGGRFDGFEGAGR